MSRYAQYNFLPQSFEIHWLSIINSFVLVLLLTGFLSIILMRVLKNDFSKCPISEMRSPRWPRDHARRSISARSTDDGGHLSLVTCPNRYAAADEEDEEEETGWKLARLEMISPR